MTKHNDNFIRDLTIINTIAVIFLAVGLLYVFLLFKKTASTDTASQIKNPSISSASYSCQNNKKVQAVFFDSKAELTLSDGRNLLLMTTVSADGVRYANPDESIVFWTRGDVNSAFIDGNSAFIQEGSRTTFADCVQTAK